MSYEYDLIEYCEDPEAMAEEEAAGFEFEGEEDALPDYSDFFVDDIDTIREIDFRELTGE